jgi:hypothetical protein
MKFILPRGSYYAEFVTSGSSGAAVNADSLPTAEATKNGADDSGFSLTVANIDAGRYKVTGTVPAGYTQGMIVQVSVAATISTIATKQVIDEFQVGPVMLPASGSMPETPNTEQIEFDGNGMVYADINAIQGDGSVERLLCALVGLQCSGAQTAYLWPTGLDANGNATFSSTPPGGTNAASYLTLTKVSVGEGGYAWTLSLNGTGGPHAWVSSGDLQAVYSDSGSPATTVDVWLASATAYLGQLATLANQATALGILQKFAFGAQIGSTATYPVLAADGAGNPLATAAGQTSLTNQINGLTRQTAVSMPVAASEFLRPATGTNVYTVLLYLYNAAQQLADPDSNQVMVDAGSSALGTQYNALLSGLSGGYMTRVSAGVYTASFAVAGLDQTTPLPVGAVYFSFAWTSNSNAGGDAAVVNIVDVLMQATIAAVKSQTDKIGTDGADSPAAQTAQSDAAAAAAALADGVAKPGDKMDLVDAPNATALAALQNGLGTAAGQTALASAIAAVKDASTFTHSFPAAALKNAPIGNPNANSMIGSGAISEGLIIAYQHGAFCNPDGSPISITVSDGQGNPISLAGATLQMVVNPLGSRSTVLWTWSTADALTIAGDQSNVILLSADATHSGQSGTLQYTIWDVTAPTAPVQKARGELRIMPNPGPK